MKKTIQLTLQAAREENAAAWARFKSRWTKARVIWLLAAIPGLIVVSYISGEREERRKDQFNQHLEKSIKDGIHR